ncbi:MAG: hypothetical protein OEY66_03070 [Gammaproteobacteria bacterium]|nr:hypothetical protein [Gammaproteobacteria bacterium]
MRRLILNLFMLFFFLIISMNLCAEENIKMQGMSVIGNKESPNLLYIVPWKAPKFTDMDDQLISSRLFDEALMPVDRQVFIRKELYQRARQDIDRK